MATEAKIKKILETKQMRLNEIMNSNNPLDPTLQANHVRRVSNARTFLEELEEVFSLAENHCPQVEIVPKKTFDEQIQKADFATMEFDGLFCQIVNVTSYPEKHLWLVYTASLECL